MVERHIVLVAPAIHWNTGNIGRTCLAAGAFLHLVEPVGFSLDEKAVRRAGLDYWPRVPVTVWPDFETLERALAPQPCEMAVFAKRGRRPLWSMPRPDRLILVFGSETEGLCPDLVRRFWSQSYYIPVTDEVRSLNLSTAAGIALYESLREAGMPHGWAPLVPDTQETSP